MPTLIRLPLAFSAFAVAILPSPLAARQVTFQSGRFVSEDRSVFNGLYATDVRIDALTLGDKTYRAQLGEFVEPADVRIWVDRTGNGDWDLITDEQLARGGEPVALALARDLHHADYESAIDAVQGLSLSHMLITDGSAAVRVDYLLTAGIFDNHPQENDVSPEAIVMGSLGGRRARLTAMIGGNLDEPILAPDSAVIKEESFAGGRTSMEIVLDSEAGAHAISVLGLDNSGDMDVRRGMMTVGYRLEIPPGPPAMFNVIGAALEWQHAPNADVLVADEPEEDAFCSWIGGGGGMASYGGPVASMGSLGSRTPFSGTSGGASSRRRSLATDLGGSNSSTPLVRNSKTSDPTPSPDDDIVPIPVPSTLLAMMAGAVMFRGRRRRA